MLKLLLIKQDAVVHEYALNEGTTSIGRGANNDIRLADISVSSNHAQINVTPNEYLRFINDIVLTDLQSTNGTRINGQTVKIQKLNNGDEIQVGRVTFRLDVEQQEDVDSTRIYLPESN